MLKLSHKNLNIWTSSIELAKLIYRITDDFPKSELYSLIAQLRRASISIPSNIAEGASRKSGKEKARFFEIARSSLAEVNTQLELTIRLKFIDQNEIDQLSEVLNELFAGLTNIIKRVKC